MNNGKAMEFYAEVLRALKRTRIPFMVGGTYAVNTYLGSTRETKDLDVFCKPGDYAKLLAALKERGFQVQVEDERWIAKVVRGKYFLDVVFNAGNAITPVTQEWVRRARDATILGVKVKMLPPTELILSKVYVQDRYKYDGADVAHLILRRSKEINWKRLLAYFDQYWEVLLVQILNFRFIYPTERRRAPAWLLDELLARVEAQKKLPSPQMKVCRGRLFSRADYTIDVVQWGFADLIGTQDEYKKR
jgi:predicted nucleotidyltransferase